MLIKVVTIWFQVCQGLEPDGIIGKQTRASIETGPAALGAMDIVGVA